MNRLTTARAPCRVPAKYSSEVAGIEDRLGQRPPVVDVEERLMLRIVGKKDGRQRQPAGHPAARADERQPQRLPVREDLNRPPAQRGRRAIGEQREPRRQACFQGGCVGSGDTGLQQLLRRGDAKLVRGVEDVHGKGARDLRRA